MGAGFAFRFAVPFWVGCQAFRFWWFRSGFRLRSSQPNGSPNKSAHGNGNQNGVNLVSGRGHKQKCKQKGNPKRNHKRMCERKGKPQAEPQMERKEAPANGHYKQNRNPHVLFRVSGLASNVSPISGFRFGKQHVCYILKFGTTNLLLFCFRVWQPGPSLVDFLPSSCLGSSSAATAAPPSIACILRAWSGLPGWCRSGCSAPVVAAVGAQLRAHAMWHMAHLVARSSQERGRSTDIITCIQLATLEFPTRPSCWEDALPAF